MSDPTVKDSIDYENDFRALPSLEDLPAWIDARPHLARATDRDGRTLLHHASLRRSTPGVVRHICARIPHLARHRASSSSGWGHRLPLHDAVDSRLSPFTARALVEAYPQALRERDGDGNLPLHCAFF
jgi:hypothetical protein